MVLGLGRRLRGGENTTITYRAAHHDPRDNSDLQHIEGTDDVLIG